MNLYVININRPPFRTETYFTNLTIVAKHPPTVTHFYRDEKGEYRQSSPSQDSRLRKLGGFTTLRQHYPDATELSAIEFAQRFGLSY